MSGRRRAPATLRHDTDFRRVTKAGTRISGTVLTAHILSSQRETRAGFVTGRAVGGAVVRNRARRLLREAWRGIHQQVRPGTEVVFTARPSIREAGTADVLKDMTRVLERGRALA